MTEAIRNCLCRLCANSHKNLSPITKECVYKIALIFEVPIGEAENDPLPTNICERCLSNVNHIWNFFKAIHAAQKLLTDFFNSEDNVETIIVSAEERLLNEFEISEENLTTKSEVISISDDDEVMKLYDETVKLNPSEVRKEISLDITNVENSEIDEIQYSKQKDDSQYIDENDQCMIRDIGEIAEPLCTSENVDTYSVKNDIKQDCNEPLYSEMINVLMENPTHQEEWEILECENRMAIAASKQRNGRHNNYVEKFQNAFENDVDNNVDDNMKIKKVYPCICYICDRGFDNGIDLQSHMRQHKLKKPFKCYLCNVQFNDLSNWHRHLKKMHGVVFEMAANVQNTSNQNQFIHELDVESQVPANAIEVRMI